MTKKASDILKDHRLRITDNRQAILEHFLTFDHAISHADIENKLGSGFDRVTIYRTLSSFEDKGIIHKVIDDTGVTKYALCSDHCDENEHADNHIHFKCTNCNQTFCLDHLGVPEFQLPDGYHSMGVDVLVQGICARCNS